MPDTPIKTLGLLTFNLADEADLQGLFRVIEYHNKTGKWPEPFSTPDDPIFAVTTSGVNFRTGAGVGFSVIEVIQKGQRVEVVDGTGEWWRVKWDGKEGYVSASFLTRAA